MLDEVFVVSEKDKFFEEDTLQEAKPISEEKTNHDVRKD